MPLSDFIDKERENRALQNVGKEELVNCLVRGLQPKIMAAAKQRYDQVCQCVARDIADGKQYASGYVQLDYSDRAGKLPEEFEKKGTSVLRREIEIENSIGTNSDWGGYDIGYFRTIETNSKFGNKDEKKLVKTRLGDEYEAAIKKLLSSDGISCELKVLVTGRTPRYAGSHIEEIGYIGINEVFSTRDYHDIHLEPKLSYSYSSLPKITTTQPQTGSAPAKNVTDKNNSPFKGGWIFIGIIFVLIMLLDYLFSSPM